MFSQVKFRKWLEENTPLSRRVINDILSRMRRADRILNFCNPSQYLQNLRNEEAYKTLSVPVRSQIKRAVLYYMESIDCR